MSILPSSRRVRWIIGGVALALVAALGFGVWYFVFRDDAPPAVDLESATRSVTTGAGSPGTDSSLDGTALDGTWSVDPSIGDSAAGTASFVGYRVQEELASIGAKTAVGRTPGVEGTLVVDGTTVTSVKVVADLRRLASDQGRRDGALRSQGLETEQFPDATFELTEPIELGTAPVEGTPVRVDAVGTLTLHGVTRTVTVPLEAQLTNGAIVVTGRLPVRFADYGIEKPTSFAVLSIEDNGIMELQLFFSKGAAVPKP